MNVIKTLCLTVLFSVSSQAQSSTGTSSNTQQYIEDQLHFPGWKGELPSKQPELPQPKPPPLNPVKWEGKVELLSWRPRVFHLEKFLTGEECDHLIELAKVTVLQTSTVVDVDSGASINSTYRTSSGTFLARNQDEVVARIEKRLGSVTHLPDNHGEALQILHYELGQKYAPHHDFFDRADQITVEEGGHRFVTVIMYLSDVEEGGETVFPLAETKVEGLGWSDCARKGLAVKAVKGNAVMFYSLTPEGKVDYDSLHESCPVLKGDKWGATEWTHVHPYRQKSGVLSAPVLEDLPLLTTPKA